MNMKTLLIILSIVTFVTNIHASTVSTYKRGSVKLISDNSATKEKRKNVAEKKARAKAKEIAGVKIEIPLKTASIKKASLRVRLKQRR